MTPKQYIRVFIYLLLASFVVPFLVQDYATKVAMRTTELIWDCDRVDENNFQVKIGEMQGKYGFYENIESLRQQHHTFWVVEKKYAPDTVPMCNIIVDPEKGFSAFMTLDS